LATLGSVRLCFHTLPGWTLISRSSTKFWLLEVAGPQNRWEGAPQILPQSPWITTKSDTVLVFHCTQLTRSPSPMSSSSVVLVPVELFNRLFHIFLLFQHRSQHLFQPRLSESLASRPSVRSFKSARIPSGSVSSQHAPVNHLDDFRVRLLLYAVLRACVPYPSANLCEACSSHTAIPLSQIDCCDMRVFVSKYIHGG